MPFRSLHGTAAVSSAAVLALLLVAASPAAEAGPSGDRALAVELTVALGDLRRLETPGLAARHAEGLRARLAGALGLLPWLLARDGRADEAAMVAALGRRDMTQAGLGDVADTLGDIAARTPFDLADRLGHRQPPRAVAEAAALHETYCAGCHDGAGDGDPDAPLPARNLGQMAGEGPPEEFLARLVAGIKGDETIAFRTPVTDRQLLALRAFYAGAE